jgi:hypothetical protein
LVLTDAMPIVPGTPVRAQFHEKFVDATIVSIEGNQLMTHDDSQPSAFDKKLPRSSIVIAQSTLDELSKPGAAESFKGRVPKKSSQEEEMENLIKQNERESKRIQEQVERNLAEAQKRMSSPSGLPDAAAFPALPLMKQSNPIDIPIPKEAEGLPLDFPLPRGTKLAVCWGKRWNWVTVLSDCKDEDVPIHWDDRTSDFDCLVHRTQLIIRRLDLKKLRIKAAKLERRVWTDSTGKHTVEAKLTSRTDTHVTLVKEDGKEVKLLIEKLSNADQKWLKDNP